MNIAFVNSTRKWGGVKTWVLDFAERLSSYGHDVRVYGRQQAFVDEARRRVGHGESATFGFDLNPATIAWFRRQFSEHHIDVVILNIGKDLATAGVAARLLNIPVVQQIGLPGDIPHRLKTRLLHAWIAPKFLCSCQYIADGFLTSLPYLRAEDLHVVLTAKRVATGPLSVSTPRRLVATQQLNPDKGHETLLRALASLDIPFELDVAGTGSHEAYLKDLAVSLGIAERIRWHGFTTRVPELLERADVFLLASLSEGLPNTLQEALAQGLLPVARDVGGVREVYTPELLPWLLPYAAGPAEFADMLRKALTLPDEQLLEMKRAARQACTTHCELDGKARELETWLATLTQKTACGTIQRQS